MSQVLKVIDGSKEVFRFEGDLTQFRMGDFQKWLKRHKFAPKKNLVKWCIASFMYGMAVRIYLA